MNKRTIAVFTGTRAEYGLFVPILKAIQEHPNLTLQLLVSGSHLDTRYGETLGEIEADGFPIACTLPLPTMGINLLQDASALLSQLDTFWVDHKPDLVLVLGDRYETLAVTVASFLSLIPVGHIHGGDVCGEAMLDDTIRHSMTKLAQLHFPATQTSARRIMAMGEDPSRVHVVGAPAIDNLKTIPQKDKDYFVETYGLNPNKPWILFTQHPISTQPEEAGIQADEILSVLAGLGDAVEIIATYPNHDPGSQAIIDLLETRYRPLPQFHIVPSLGRVNYLNILRHVALVIGNSSSGLLETAYFKTPCLNIGDRQKGRERGSNVLDVPQDSHAIQTAINLLFTEPEALTALRQGDHPFGEGHCAQNIVDVLAHVPLAPLMTKPLCLPNFV